MLSALHLASRLPAPEKKHLADLLVPSGQGAGLRDPRRYIVPSDSVPSPRTMSENHTLPELATQAH